jgi:outer membrane protein OmpA-like peptidoglycan-associated protein
MRRIIAAAGFMVLAGCSVLRTMGGAPPVYAVFFDEKNVTLTADARVIVDDAAKDAKAHPLMVVQITGPSTKAATGYDPTIAEARMRIVEQTLISDGVPADHQFRTEPTPDMLVADKTGRQRVEIRIVDTKPHTS